MLICIATDRVGGWREREHWNSCIKSPLQAESEAVTGSLKIATGGTAPTHRQGSTSDPESEEVTLPSPKNLTADISCSTRCSDMVKASRCNRAVCIQSSASPPRKLARARGLCQGALKIQLRHLTCSS